MVATLVSLSTYFRLFYNKYDGLWKFYSCYSSLDTMFVSDFSFKPCQLEFKEMWSGFVDLQGQRVVNVVGENKICAFLNSYPSTIIYLFEFTICCTPKLYTLTRNEALHKNKCIQFSTKMN